MARAAIYSSSCPIQSPDLDHAPASLCPPLGKESVVGVGSLPHGGARREVGRYMLSNRLPGRALAPICGIGLFPWYKYSHWQHHLAHKIPKNLLSALASCCELRPTMTVALSSGNHAAHPLLWLPQCSVLRFVPKNNVLAPSVPITCQALACPSPAPGSAGPAGLSCPEGFAVLL